MPHILRLEASSNLVFYHMGIQHRQQPYKMKQLKYEAKDHSMREVKSGAAVAYFEKRVTPLQAELFVATWNESMENKEEFSPEDDR